jgi:hypothetical protein
MTGSDQPRVICTDDFPKKEQQLIDDGYLCSGYAYPDLGRVEFADIQAKAKRVQAEVVLIREQLRPSLYATGSTSYSYYDDSAEEWVDVWDYTYAPDAAVNYEMYFYRKLGR